MSFDEQTLISAEQRRNEIAILLACSLVRMNRRCALDCDQSGDDYSSLAIPADPSASRLELSGDSGLTVV
ncbi:hypothetical protein [Novipirellula artificiosorum]|uniref:Uncharacterized protein n=1 Tax=Novipirellula artificiosorum TaxID=2528016 RepID=A0A5C6CHT9_9BACT|nr:hypothetical protein [Novipirellula artificiosorum]TWU22851.1 hypothetical protein Poly41_71130 [Novipirellula artificiosorum]